MIYRLEMEVAEMQTDSNQQKSPSSKEKSWELTGTKEATSPSPLGQALAEKSCLRVKVICLGDSAVGKSKLLERFLINSYKPEGFSTYAANLFGYDTQIDGRDIAVEFWDTAGQEKFKTLHMSYYHQAHSCILVFDCTRKITYKNLESWIRELKNYRAHIPCFMAANKIDDDPTVTKKPFALAKTYNMPLYFVSGANGTNVAKLFNDAIKAAVDYRLNPTDVADQIILELEPAHIEPIDKKFQQKKDENSVTKKVEGTSDNENTNFKENSPAEKVGGRTGEQELSKTAEDADWSSSDESVI